MDAVVPGRWAWIVLVVLSAGRVTADEGPPHVVFWDDGGDWEPSVPAALAPRAGETDILQASIGEETMETLNFTLQVANLAPGAEGAYMLRMNATHTRTDRPENYSVGMRAFLHRDAPPAFDAAAGNLHGGQVRWQPWLVSEGSVSYGSPGYVHWSISRTYWTGIRDDFVLHDFDANTSSLVAGRLEIHDRAAGNGHPYLVGRGSLRDLPTFVPPSRNPDLVDGPDDVEGALGIEAAWIDDGNDWLNLTLRVGEVRPAALDVCPRSYLGFHFGMSEDGGAYEDRTAFRGATWLQNRFNRTQVRHFGDDPTMGPMSGGWMIGIHSDWWGSAVEGKPGYVRYSFERTGWKGTTDFLDTDLHFDSECADGRAGDVLDHDGAHGIPSPAWPISIAFITWAAARARRRQ